jgi:hypothetical protein
MSAPLMPCAALRGHARGRDFLRAAGRDVLPGLVCALVYITNAPRRRQPTQARVAGDVETEFRRRGEAPMARRWRLGIVTLGP